jgi:hypothetical protein
MTFFNSLLACFIHDVSVGTTNQLDFGKFSHVERLVGALKSISMAVYRYC